MMSKALIALAVFSGTVYGYGNLAVADEISKVPVLLTVFIAEFSPDEIKIVNRGSVIKIVDVMINGRAECTLIDPDDVVMQNLQALLDLTVRLNPGSSLKNNVPGVTPGARYWKKDDILQLGESVTVKNKCQGEIVRVKVVTDKGERQYGFQ
jgi:hypothetical protein